MNKRYKKVCTNLNYIENWLILASAVTGCVSISIFAFLVSITIDITSSAIELKNYAISVGMKKH